MKFFLTAEAAIDAFIKAKKEKKEVPSEVIKALKNYKSWGEGSLKGLINASGFFPEILIEENMEKNILNILAKYKTAAKTAPSALDY